MFKKKTIRKWEKIREFSRDSEKVSAMQTFQFAVSGVVRGV